MAQAAARAGDRQCVGAGNSICICRNAEPGSAGRTDRSWAEGGRGSRWQSARGQGLGASDSIEGGDVYREICALPDGECLRVRSRRNRKVRGVGSAGDCQAEGGVVHQCAARAGEGKRVVTRRHFVRGCHGNRRIARSGDTTGTKAGCNARRQAEYGKLNGSRKTALRGNAGGKASAAAFGDRHGTGIHSD